MNASPHFTTAPALRAGPLAIGLLLAACCLSAAAQSRGVYRCGNVMQDRPCDGSAPAPAATPSGGTGTRAAAPPPPAGNLPAVAPSAERQCVQRGEYAERVAWRREGGAPLDRQLADIPGGVNTIEGSAQAAVARRVYASRGSAAEIRAAVQADCLQKAARETSTQARPYNADECQMLRQDRQKLEARSASAANESQRQLYRQVRAELDEKMLMRGCNGPR